MLTQVCEVEYSVLAKTVTDQEEFVCFGKSWASRYSLALLADNDGLTDFCLWDAVRTAYSSLRGRSMTGYTTERPGSAFIPETIAVPVPGAVLSPPIRH